MSLDRKLGRWLDGSPLLRKIARTCYLRFAYLISRKRVIRDGLSPVVIFDGTYGYYDTTPWSLESSHIIYHSIIDPETFGIEKYDFGKGELARLGTTKAWNWQQGARLQWLPGHDAILFNMVSDGKLIAKIHHLSSDMEHFCPMPVQTLHPDGRHALTLNYRRLNALRPEYGYSIDVENFSLNQPNDQDGVWHFGLFDNNPKLIISISDLIKRVPRDEMTSAQHKVNHIIYSPSGNKFVFMHRWMGPRGKFSRLYVAENPCGSEIKLLMDERMVSHYCWRDDDHLLVYGRTASDGDRYYLINVNTGQKQVVGKGILDKYGDGHPGYSPDGRWIVTDTYPDKARMRHLLLFDTHNDQLHKVASFFAPWKFDGANRVDLHPRWCPSGRYISVDSAHEGKRKMYILDVEGIVKK